LEKPKSDGLLGEVIGAAHQGKAAAKKKNRPKTDHRSLPKSLLPHILGNCDRIRAIYFLLFVF